MTSGPVATYIQEKGPVTVECFMDLCTRAYLRAGHFIGKDGDFITAPECTQVFGEIIAMWWVWVWRRIGSPSAFDLVELGPGRATLMADILGCVPDAFSRGMRLHLVDQSPDMIRQQKTRLKAFDPRWHSSFQAFQDGSRSGSRSCPLFVMANEFFDALPVRQFVRRQQGWQERMIAWDDAGHGLRFVLCRAPTKRFVGARQRRFKTHAKDGDIFEVGEKRSRLGRDIAGAIYRRGGAALVIDYGYWKSVGRDTLAVISGHRPCPALERPGLTDISADVDFASLAGWAGDVPVTLARSSQADFLLSLGLRERTRRLAAAGAPSAARSLYSAAARLVSSGGMGQRFQVLAMSYDKGRDRLSALPGLV